MSKKTNGPDTATAPAGKRTIILQREATVDTAPGSDGVDLKPLDYHEDFITDCTGVRDARRTRRRNGALGKFRIIEVLDEFKVGHEETPREVITRGGQ